MIDLKKRFEVVLVLNRHKVIQIYQICQGYGGLLSFIRIFYFEVEHPAPQVVVGALTALRLHC
jgi:hypothetical protein